jgi:hypothetical protein
MMLLLFFVLVFAGTVTEICFVGHCCVSMEILIDFCSIFFIILVVIVLFFWSVGIRAEALTAE